MKGPPDMITIAVDMMGGDRGTEVSIPGLLLALSRDSSLRILAYALPEVVDALNDCLPEQDKHRCVCMPVSQSVPMDMSPIQALRRQKDSSMRHAIDAVERGEASACVSSGNTGALMAMSHYVVGMIAGIARPAIMANLPTRIAGKSFLMLDLGANVDATAEQLHQFAVMGAYASQALTGHQSPSVALLNIGHEMIKGNEQVKLANQRLLDSHLHYKGYIEGHQLMNGDIDVVVCDGFVGNIVLKTMEGLVSNIFQQIKARCLSQVVYRLFAPVLRAMLAPLRKKFKLSSYNGAVLLGLKKVVVKSHGGTDIEGFAAAINRGKRVAIFDLVNKIEQAIQVSSDVTQAEGAL